MQSFVWCSYLIYWFTGQPGSGKTTLGVALKKRLGVRFQIDGDDLRVLSSNKNYSKEGRVENIKLAQNIALFLHNKSEDVIVSLVAPYKWLRDDFKNSAEVTEIYLHTTDIRGKENHFADDYEPPTDNYIDIDTTNISISDCLDLIDSGQNLVPTDIKKRTIAIDFDGVIHRYSKGFKGKDNAYDSPNENITDALDYFKSKNYRLVVFSTRPKEVIADWLKKYDLQDYFSDITDIKIPAKIYIDDRGYKFESWNKTLEELEL